jgi:cation transport regulator ChaB
MSLSTKLGEIEEKNLAVGRRAKPQPDFTGQKIPSKLISSVFYEYKTFSSSFASFTSHIKDQQRREDEQERREAAAPTSSSSNVSSQLPRHTQEIRAFSLNFHHTKMKKNREKEVSDNHTL